MMYDQELAVADEVEMHTMNTGRSMTSIILRSLHPLLPVQKLPMTILMQIRTSLWRELRRRRSSLVLVSVHLTGTNLHEIGQSNRSHSYGDRGPGRGGGQRQHRPSESPKVFLPSTQKTEQVGYPRHHQQQEYSLVFPSGLPPRPTDAGANPHALLISN